MSVVRGRPPGLAGGIRGAARAYCSSLRACPAPKWPTSARVSAVHMTCLQQGSPPAEPPTQPACALAHPSRIGFSNGLLGIALGVTLGIIGIYASPISYSIALGGAVAAAVGIG